MDKYFKVTDGIFTYYESVVDGHIKWELSPSDKIVPRDYNANALLNYFNSRKEAVTA